MFSRQLTHRVVRKAAWTAFTVAAVMAAAASTPAMAAADGYEGEPTLQYSSFKGLPAASGAGYTVARQVPVSGYYGQFTLHTDSGDMQADGASLLSQRVREIQPTIALQKLSSSKVFTDALAKSAQGGAEAIGRAVSHPVETVQNAPAGIGRFFKSMGKTVENVASPSSNGSQGAAVADALGINKAKRELAQKVGADPYTTNPFLAKRLNDLAQAAVAGGLSIDVVLAVSTGGAAMIVSTTKTVSNLAWSLPPESVREVNDKDLAKLGVDQETRSALLGNRWFTPTMALSYVEAMKTLGVREGAGAFTALAAGAQSEVEARFYIAQLRLARFYAKSGNAISSMATRGRIGTFRTKAGGLFIPAPLDYLTWTQGANLIVDAQPQPDVRTRTVWITGKASPKATAELRKAGWITRFDVKAD